MKCLYLYNQLVSTIFNQFHIISSYLFRIIFYWMKKTCDCWRISKTCRFFSM